MNIFKIAFKEIKHTMKDFQALTFMIAFPLVLMLILGVALTNAFGNKVTVDDIHVVYKIDTNAKLASAFQEFIHQSDKTIHFIKLPNQKDGRKEISENNYNAYIEVSDKGIQLFKSSQNIIESSIVQSLMGIFVSKYNLIETITSVEPSKVNEAITKNVGQDYVHEKSLNADKKPSAMDYFAITMTTMIAMYSALNARSLIHEERVRKTGIRLLVSPISKMDIFLGKVIGALVINSICTFIVMGFSHFIFKANWGDHIVYILLILLSEVFLAVSFGVGIDFIAKTGEASRMIVMITLQLISAFGGAYFPINDTSGFMKIVTNLSPLSWINKVINQVIYANDISRVLPTMGLNLAISVLFFGIAIFSLQRREGL